MVRLERAGTLVSFRVRSVVHHLRDYQFAAESECFWNVDQLSGELRCAKHRVAYGSGGSAGLLGIAGQHWRIETVGGLAEGAADGWTATARQPAGERGRRLASFLLLGRERACLEHCPRYIYGRCGEFVAEFLVGGIVPNPLARHSLRNGYA